MRSARLFVGALGGRTAKATRYALASISFLLTLTGLDGAAQEVTKIARIGYLGQAPAANFVPRVEALRAGLLALGYVEGKNLILDFRWADAPAHLPALASELIRAGSEVIFAPSSIETG